MRDYYDHFTDFYKELIRGFEAAELIIHRTILIELIDSDMFYDSLLIDEAVILLNLIEDECAVRLSNMCVPLEK